MAGFLLQRRVLFYGVMLFIASLYRAGSINHCHQDISYIKKGDLNIGGLLPLHHPKLLDDRVCGVIRSITALREMEAMVYAINWINMNETILPGVRLGFHIRDTCFSVSVTLRSTLNFIPGNKCAMKQPPIVGVVGARKSSSSVQAALLLSLFRIPQISYLSTSDVLSNKNRYPYFMRTVGPDVLQVAAIFDLLHHFNWTYISFISSDDVYGRNGQNKFQQRILKSKVCISMSNYYSVSSFSDNTVLDKLIGELLELQENTDSVVVILFVDILLARKIFASAERVGVKRRFIWIGSDGWSNYGDLAIAGYEEVTVGKLTNLDMTKENNTQLTLSLNKRVHLQH